ncbi:MAG: Do family serine endopeptidase [Caulobacteraceae bacterium]
MAVKKTGYFVGAIAGAGVAAAALAGAGMSWPPAHAEQMPVIRASTAPIFAPPPGAPLSFADIFDRVSPAVVSIDVTTKVDAKKLRTIPGFENFPFDLVPKGQTPNPDDKDKDAGPQALSSGSGFFISPDGYIVTNNHVLENATEIKVTLKDERELVARVIGKDEATDLAVIKVEGRNFPFVNFENGSKPRVGDWVIAVGNPFGLGGTATAGIVSAYGRDIGDTAFVNYIQIDAPINRGNSGGPSFDIYGRVIGVNTAIFSPSGGSVGIGFAIPADVADTVTKQLISGGKVSRGYMGATIQNLTPEIAESLGIAGRKGALISDVTPGGPAAKAGLRSGDVVLQYNGENVSGSSDLTRHVGGTRTGEAFRLSIIREGKPMQVEIRAGVRPSEAELNARNPNNDGDSDGANPTPNTPSPALPKALGMTFGPLDAAAQRRYSLGADVRGVVIESVLANTDAGRKGLRRGDVVVKANERPTTSPADVPAAVDAAKRAGRTSVLLQIIRDGQNRFVPIKIEP